MAPGGARGNTRSKGSRGPRWRKNELPASPAVPILWPAATRTGRGLEGNSRAVPVTLTSTGGGGFDRRQMRDEEGAKMQKKSKILINLY